MAQKGINYAITEAKQELLQSVRELVGRGIPVSVIGLILFQLIQSINETEKNVVEKEQEKYYEDLEKEEKMKQEQESNN